MSKTDTGDLQAISASFLILGLIFMLGDFMLHGTIPIWTGMQTLMMIPTLIGTYAFFHGMMPLISFVLGFVGLAVADGK